MTELTEVSTAPKWSQAAATSAAGQRILIVDDNVDAAESLAALLRCLGADAATAYSGAAALEHIAAHKPAVVVFDIGMPGMDGYELARRTRATPEGADIMLVALTGWGNDEARRKEAGIDHHLVKPVELAVIEGLLARRSSVP